MNHTVVRGRNGEATAGEPDRQTFLGRLAGAVLRPPAHGPRAVDPGHHRHHGAGPGRRHPLREQVHRGQHALAAGAEHPGGALPGAVGGHGRHRLPHGDADPGQPRRHRLGRGPGATPALRAQRDEPVLRRRRPPDRPARQHRLRPGPVQHRHGRHPDRRGQAGRQRGPVRRRTRGSPSSSAATRSPRRSPRRPARARASASRPPSSSCCWPSGPWSPWACP